MFKSLWYKFYSSRLVGKAIAIWYILRGKGVVYRATIRGKFVIDYSGVLIRENHFVNVAPVPKHRLALEKAMRALAQSALE